MNPFKGNRASLFAVLVPFMLPNVVPDPIQWIWLTLSVVWVLHAFGIIHISLDGSSQPTDGSSQSADSTSGASGRAESAHRGEIVALGNAPYEFKEENSPSYYITLRSERGDDKTLWGVDLKRVAHETPLAVGETVALEFLGRQAVVVDKPVRNDQGKIVERRKVNTHRNTWKATVMPA